MLESKKMGDCIMYRNRNFIKFLRLSRRFFGIPFLILYLVVFNVFIDFAQAQEITPDGNTITNLNVNGNITDITTGTINQNTGFNSFNKFNIDSGNIVNLHLPGGTENLINTVNGGTSYLNGILNSVMDGDIGGNVYFLNPHGMMVGTTGAINVGSLTAVTPTSNFMDGIYTSPGNISSSALASILDGSISISSTGLISIAGKVNAINDINLSANNVSITANDTSSGIINTGAVFSEDSVVNTDKIGFSDVVNINGAERGVRMAEENGDIVIEAGNDISSDGIIAADGADGLDAGSITLNSGNTVNLNNGSEILARGTGIDSSSGDITILAEKTDTPTLIEAEANTGIYIDGSTLIGDDITMTAKANADYSWSVTDPHDIVTGTVAALGSSMAGVGVGIVQATADAEIIISDGSSIEADGSVELTAESTASAGMLSFNPNLNRAASIGFVYGNLDSNANVEIQDGASIKASDLSLSAVNNADLDISVYAISPSASAAEAAIAVTNADIDSSVSIGSEAYIDVSDSVTASAINNSSFSTTTTAMALGEGNAGIAATFFDADTNAEASVAADILDLEDLTIEAFDNITKNKAASSATAGSGIVQRTLLSGVASGTDFIKNKMSSKGPSQLNSNSGATEKPKLAGAVTIADTDHSATAFIANSTEIEASGDVVLAAKVSDAGLQNHASSAVESKADGDSSNPTASYSLSAAVAYGSYTHNADAHLGEDTKITAGHLGLNSDVIIPYEITWHKWEGLSTITDKINGNLGVANGFMTGYANATGTPSEGGIAGSVNYLDFNNNSEAYIGRNSQVYIIPGSSESWTSTLPSNSILDENSLPAGGSVIDWDTALNISANTEITGVYAAGNLSVTLNGAGGDPGAASAGGAYTQINYTNNTKAYVAEGTVLESKDNDPEDGLEPSAVDMSITASSSEKLIAIGPSAGRGASFGLNGVFTLANIDSTTEASIDDEAKVSAKNLLVNAEDEVESWSITGAFNKSESAGVGISTSINNITTNTSAFIGDNDSNNENGSQLVLSDGKVVADNVNVTARTDGRIETISVAAAMASSSDPADSGQPGFVDKVKDKLGISFDKSSDKAGSSNQTEPTKPKFGIGVSGSASVNIVELGTSAYIDDAVLDLSGGLNNSLILRAVNDTDITAASGSAALVRAKNPSTKFSAALAGSVAVNDLANTSSAYIKDSTVTGADDIAVNALSGGEQLAIAIGAAVNSSAKKDKAASAAGSVSVSLTDNTVESYIEDSDIKGKGGLSGVDLRNLDLIAYDRTLLGTGGGSLIAGGKAGFGAAVTYSEISNNSNAYLSGTSVTDYDNVQVHALTAAKIASGGAMAGFTTDKNSGTFGGAVVISNINNTTSAEIKEDSDIKADKKIDVIAKDTSAEESLDTIIDSHDQGHENSSSLDYQGSEIGATDSDGSSILSVAGVVQAGGNNVGISFNWNEINNNFESRIDDSTVAAGNAANSGEINVIAESNAAITGFAVGTGVSTGQFAGGGSIAINEISNKTIAEITDSVETGESGLKSITADSLTVKAEDNSKIDSLAGQVTISTGNVSIGGTVAHNDISNQSRASIEGIDININEATDILAANNSTIRTLSVSGGGSKTFAFNGSASSSHISNTTTAKIIDSQADDGTNSVLVKAEDNSEIEALSGAAAFSSSVAVGAAVAVNRVANDTSAFLSGSSDSSIYDLENILIISDADSTIKSIAVGVGAGVDVGAAGSVATNFIENNTLSYINEGAKVKAQNNLGVIAESDEAITNAAGSVGLGFAAVGVGESVTVNNISGNTKAYISGSDTEVTALAKDSSDKLTVNGGQLSSNLDLASGLDLEQYARTDLASLRETEEVTGIAVNASANHSVENIVANVAGGQYGGVAGTMNFSILSGNTEAYIDSAQINPGNTAVTAGTGGSEQSVSVKASDHAYSNGFVGTVAVGGAAGIGLGVDTNVFSNDTRAYIKGSDNQDLELNAENKIDVAAISSQGVSSLVVGGAGGGVALVGSGTIGTFEGTTEAYLKDTIVNSGDLNIDAEHLSRFFVAAGGVSIGGTAAAGTFSVGTDQSKSRAYIENSTVQAEGLVNVSARNETEIENWAVSGSAAGSTGIAGGVTVSMVNNTTNAYVKNSKIGEEVEKSEGLSIRAEDIVKIDNKTGAGALGLNAGVGASAAITKVNNSTQSYLENTDTYTLNDIQIEAYSERELSMIAVSLGAGGTVGIGGTAAVTLVGQDLSDEDMEEELDKGGDGTLSNVNDFTSTDHLKSTGTGISEEELNQVNNAGKTTVDLNSGLVSGTSAQIRGDSTVKAGGSITVDASEKNQVDINAGAGGLGLAAIGGAVGVMDITNNVDASVLGTATGRPELMSSNGGINIKAEAANLNEGEDAASVKTYQGSAGAVSLGAAVAVADLKNNVNVQIDQGSSLEIVNGDGELRIEAIDSSSVNAEARGYNGGLAAVGVVVADANKSGNTTVMIGNDQEADTLGTIIRLASGQMTVNSQRTGRVNAFSQAGAGGVIAGSGSSAEANESGNIEAKIGNYVVVAGSSAPVQIKASAQPQVSARAEGFNGSLYASAGVSVAQANADNNIEASIGDDSYISAKDLTIKAENKVNGTAFSAKSYAEAVSGGLLLGLNATVSNANTEIDVKTSIASDTEFNITNGDLQVMAENNSSQQADVTGVVAGFAAAGANLAKAKANSSTEASVAQGVHGIVSGELAVRATGEDKLFAVSTSGSGGVVSGAAAKASTDADSDTRAELGGGSDTTKLSAGKIDLQAEHTTTFNGKSSSINAAVVGGSGAIARNNIDSNVKAEILDNAKLEAEEVDVIAHNVINKPWLSGSAFNAKAGSGGLLDGAASTSQTDIELSTDLIVGNNSVINITESADGEAGSSDFKAINDITTYDKTKLDSGGAISVALAESKINVNSSTAEVKLGSGTSIDSAGTVNISASSNADIQTSANAKTYGGAGAAQGESQSSLNSNNKVDIKGNVDITSKEDINIYAGPLAKSGKDINITANTDLYNKTVLPIETKPEADAALTQTNTISLGTGSQLRTVGDISLITEKGDRNVYGYGVGKDLYREALEEIGSFFSNLVGGDDLSLEIKGGSSSDNSLTGVGVNGIVEVGIENQRYLYINEDGIVNKDNSSEGITVTVTEETLANDIQAQIDELTALIDAVEGSTPSGTTNPQLAEEKGRLEAEKNQKSDVKINLSNTKSTYEDRNATDQETINTNNDNIATWNILITLLDKSDPNYSENKQILQNEIDSANDANNTLEENIAERTDLIDGYEIYVDDKWEHVKGITEQISDINTRISEINSRIDQLDSLIVQDDNSEVGNLLSRYQAERAMLVAQLAGLGDTSNVKVINVDQEITARSSNIYINGDNLTGSGEILAPGDTLIEIENKSPYFLRTSKLTIPDEAGGHIYLNNVSVTNNSEINNRNRFGSYVYGGNAAFQEILTADNTTPRISVLNSFIPYGDSERGADLFVDADIRNLHGEAFISSLYGSVQVMDGVDIVADTIKISAGRDITIGYKDGFRNVEGDIKENWDSIINGAKAGNRDSNSGSQTAEQLLGISGPYDPSIIAGNNVFIAGENLNINGVIQSGLPNRSLIIPDTEELHNQITAFEASYRPGIDDPIFKDLYINNAGEIGSEDALSAIPVFYNADTNTLELAPVDTMGGYMELFGHIMNTSVGELRVMDGYSKINITNETDLAVKLSTINTGDDIEGIIKITDTGKRTESDNPLVTVYQRLGDEVQEFNNYNSDNVDFANSVNTNSGRNTAYNPLENQYYSWTMMDFTSWKEWRYKYEEKWIGITTDTETSYGDSTGYNYKYNVPIGAAVLRQVDGHSEQYWYDRTYYLDYTQNWHDTTDWETITNYVAYKKYRKEQGRSAEQTILHNHNISASNPIDINFLGYDQGEILIDSVGDIIIDGQIKNSSGQLHLDSAGSILQGENEMAVLSGNQLDINAGNGIGEQGAFVKTNLLDTGHLTANTANGSIYLEETKGNLVFSDITATGGDVYLTAESSIVGQDGNALIQGKLVNLNAVSGEIGAEDNVVRIDSQAITTGGLTAESASDINIVEIDGDLYLNSVESLGGNVNIEVAAGDMIDNNTVETVDTRTEEELLNLWDEMMLIGDAAEDSAEQTVAAYERMKNREYNTYRQYRNKQVDANGNPIPADSYSAEVRIGLTDLEKDYYRNELGWNAEQVNSLEDKMTADYHQYHQAYSSIGDSDVDGWSYKDEEGWSYSVARPTDGDGNTIYNPDLYNQDKYQEWDSLVAGTSWTEGQLANSINIGFLKEVSDTEIRIEDANVSANDISLTASSGSIGNKLTDTPTTITLNGRKWSELTDQEKLMIMTAERSDIEIVSDNEIKIINVEDIDIEAEGALTATARDQIYLGSESNVNVNSISAGDGVRLKTSKGIYNADDSASVRISGQDTILEAGQYSIGTGDNQFLIDIEEGVLTARAGDNIYLKTYEDDDLNLDTIYAVHHVNLVTAGGIYNATNPNMNIRAESLNLEAMASIGENTASGFLKIGLDPTGELTAVAGNGISDDIYINSPGHSLNTSRITAGGDITIIGSEDINIGSTTGGIETQYGNVTIDTARSIIDADTDESAGITAQDINLIVDGAGLSDGSTDDEFVIGTVENALEINTLSQGKLSAEAPDGVFITETAGDMNINTVSSTRGGVGLSSLTGDINLGTINAETGNVGLIADGSISSQAGIVPVINSVGLDMLAHNGQIGSSDNSLRVNTSIATEGIVSAEALNGVYIIETIDALNSDTILSKNGEISLATLAGDINSESVLLELGDIRLSSTGSIESGTVSSGTGNISLNANEDIDSELVSTQSGEIVLTAGRGIQSRRISTGAGNIDMNASSGDIGLGTVNTADGEIHLLATNSIYNNQLNDDVTNLQSNYMLLTAENGSIGTLDRWITVNATDRLNATAYTDIYLNQYPGNFVSDYILSETGSIGIAVPEGNITAGTLSAAELVDMETAGDILIDQLDAAELNALVHNQGALLSINQANILRQVNIRADNILLPELNHLGSNPLYLDIVGGSKEMADNVSIDIALQDYNQDEAVVFDRLYSDNSYINAQSDDLIFNDQLLGSRADIYNNYYYVIADNDNLRLFTSDMQLYPEDSHFYLIMESDRMMLTDAYVINYNPDFIVNDFSTENNFVRETNKMPQVVSIINNKFATLLNQDGPLLADRSGTVFVNIDYLGTNDNSYNTVLEEEGDQNE